MRILTAERVMVKLFDYTQNREKGWEEWQFRSMSQAHVRKLVAEDKAEAVRRMKDGVACVVGYRALTPTRALKRSACTLTLATMNAVSKRADREELDLYERLEVEKFDVWALVGDTKAPAVRPRISLAERCRAERMLGVRRLAIGATFCPGELAAA